MQEGNNTSNPLEILKGPKIILEKEDLSEFNADTSKIQDFMQILERYGAPKLILDKDSDGPILVIFRETHNNHQTKKENFLAFQELIDYFNFLGTEGGDGELIGNLVEKTMLETKQLVDLILGGYYGFSSEAVADKNIGRFSVIGVDLPSNTIKKARENAKALAYNIAATKLLDPKDPKITQDAQKIFDEYIQKLIVGRNSIFIEKLIWYLKTKRILSGKGFIGITTGASHAENLSEIALNRGFKGVIVFTPHSYMQNY